MIKFGEWQPEETAPTNTAVLICVEDCERCVCRAIKVDMGTGIRWKVYAWGIGRDVPMDRVRCWMPLPDPPGKQNATNLDAARAQGRREGLEEAARIAEMASHGGYECYCEKCLTACLIESDIRAAIAKEPKA